jgi:RNA polymerase sigma factor (sigma-70 family)
MVEMAESKAEAARLEADAPEATLLLGLREGRPEAAGAFYDRFSPSLLAFSLAWFPEDRALAEDVVVQSFANAMRHLRSYDSRRASLLTWLCGIARRQIRDELRLRARRKSVPASAQTPLENATDLADSHDLAEEVASRLDAQRLLVQLKTELPALEFEVLILHSLDQFSAREIGRVIGRSERAVHSLLHRAKAKARERLERDE